MTREQIEILKMDSRRHRRIAALCETMALKEEHEAIAAALDAAIDEGTVRRCSSEKKSASSPRVSLSTTDTKHARKRRGRHLK